MPRRSARGTRQPNAEEAAALDHAATAYTDFIAAVGEQGVVGSEPEQAACTACLEALEAASERFGLKAAPRIYREHFSANYRALFPDQARRYRIDILKASYDNSLPIWVNGTKFELSSEAVGRGDALQRAWGLVGEMLQQWHLGLEDRRPGRAECIARLTGLDAVWADFEHCYVSELIWIENQARNLIVEAIQREVELRLAEEGDCKLSIAEATRSFVASIGRLNAVANIRRRGRDDLGVDILLSAVETLRRCDRGELGSVEACSLARTLASTVLESYNAMRKYLREVSFCLERLDPHLCHNAGLVARLADWEESWEMGSKYVRQAHVLDGICDAVAEIQAVERIAPELSAMIRDCDVELFLVLPRLLWLRFAAASMSAALPEEGRCGDDLAAAAALLRELLPHRFEGPAPGKDCQQELCGDLVSFLERVRQTIGLLANNPGDASHDHTGVAVSSPLAMLTRRAVVGSYSPTPGVTDVGLRATEDLMRELEGWSVELQRHCPEEWNQCVALLVQCVSGRKVCSVDVAGAPTDSAAEFEV